MKIGQYLKGQKKTEPFGYVAKPFQVENLRKVIEIALLRHKTEQEKDALAREQMKGLNESLENTLTSTLK